MRLTKVQRYLEKLRIDYNYYFLNGETKQIKPKWKADETYDLHKKDERWGSITIIDEKQNYTHIWEGENKIIFFWREKDTDNIVNEFFKTQDEVVEFFTVKNGVIIIKKDKKI